MSLEEPESDLSNALHWVWSCQLQLDRYIASFRSEMTDHTVLSQLRSRKLFSATSYDEHAVLVAARNLLRKLDQLRDEEPRLRLDQAALDSIAPLRNAYEHFDEELRPRTRQELERLKASPGQVQFGAGDLMIGGVLSVKQFRAALAQLESELLAREQAATDSANLDTPRRLEPDA